MKTDADRAEAAREGAETAQLAVDTQVGEVNRLHTEVLKWLNRPPLKLSWQ
ncbi:hypothetical protein [Yersinia enterocolitica]|uniref:hypothetical protein n=1 Tax=Yersinia enterocolitica TaxID=630 RepID=UPI001EFCE34E|nr:hypothetical protein [Yersinia enterocolitica]MCG9177481.1 hypothetical protein [Yersinia enterocolitica]